MAFKIEVKKAKVLVRNQQKMCVVREETNNLVIVLFM